MAKQSGNKADARAIVARLSREGAALRERELLAPLLPGGRIRTRLGGMVYEFKPRGSFVGWGRFRPIDEREAEPIGEALPWERAAYLELFPALRVILLWPDPNPKRQGTWWALPYNESDARQRFGLAGAEATPLLPVFLCDPSNGADRFERVVARVDGVSSGPGSAGSLWFDGPDLLADPRHAAWLRDAAAQEEAPERFLPGLSGSERLALLYAQIRKLDVASAAERLREAQTQHRTPRERQEWLRHLAAHDHLESRLRHMLAKADATLHGFAELPTSDGSPGSLIVEWSARGETHRYRSTVTPDATVISSGICLSGRDRDFDLTSLVSVVADSPGWAGDDEVAT